MTLGLHSIFFFSFHFDWIGIRVEGGVYKGKRGGGSLTWGFDES